MSEKIKPLRLSTDDLALKLANAWRTRGPLRNYAKQFFGSDNQHDIDRDKGIVFIRHFNIEQFFWFKEKPSFNVARESEQKEKKFPYGFYVHNPELNADEISKIEEKIKKRLEEGISSDQRKQFYKIFGEPIVEQGEIEFRGMKYSGIVIKTPIVELPTGIAGKLSDNLFSYGYNIISLPAERVARIRIGQDASDVKKGIWYDFG